MTARGDCPRCGQTNVPFTARGSVASHDCPHGKRCTAVVSNPDVPICGLCLDAKNQRAIASLGHVLEAFDRVFGPKGRFR